MPFDPRGRAASARSPDWVWAGLGVTIASASASFAAYMIVTAPGVHVDSHSTDFSVFAHFDRRGARSTVAGGTSAQRGLLMAGASPDIDREPTGSIIAAAPAEGPVSTIARSAPNTPLRDFVVRDVFGNKALIEHGQNLTLVRPGTILDGAGEVLAIERRGDSWVVRTASGIIGGV